MYDVIIIGAGVSGAATARKLSRYNVKTCVIEKEEDVCCGTSKANSAIVHAGYDALEGSLMAKLNVRGNQMMGELSKELDFPFKKNGSLVVCLSEEDMLKLQTLYERGVKNGVKELRILNREELKEMEPNISDEACGALYAPTVHGNVIVGPTAIDIEDKEGTNTTREGLDPDTLSKEERDQLIKEKPEYGNIICRCEMVTEGEILDAIRRPLGAKSLDGVKRRTRAGMGRCQAGFCSPRTMEILARERNVSMFEITKSGGDSKIVTDYNKDSL